MPRRKPCAACHHPQRLAIDAALAGRAMSLRAIIRTYGGLNLGGLSRHRDRHLSRQPIVPVYPARAAKKENAQPSNV